MIDLVEIKYSLLPVCDKPYHTNNGELQKGEEIGVLRSYVLDPQCEFQPLPESEQCGAGIGYKVYWKRNDTTERYQWMMVR